jgi:two-component system, OmpR family, phosphate regulon response regulator PhoB
MLSQNLKLVVTDDMEPLLRHILSEGGFHISAAHTMEEAMHNERDPSDLVIVDAALCPMRVDTLDADEFASAPTPVLLLADADNASDSELPDDRMSDVLLKPVNPDQLIARVRALLRKVRTAPLRAPKNLSFSGIEIDLSRHRVYRDHRRVDLGPLGFRLLCHFVRHPQRAFSRQALIAFVWPRDALIDPRTVDAQVVALRKALNRDGAPNVIQTVRSIGYSLDKDD